MLEIMKDSRIGTNGVIAIALDFIFRLGLLFSMPNRIIGVSIYISTCCWKKPCPITYGYFKIRWSKGWHGRFILFPYVYKKAYH